MNTFSHRGRWATSAAWAGLLGLAVADSTLAAAATSAACHADSGLQRSTVVELYTSEGCNSCPPADRWLGTLPSADNGVVALAFHVDYWDHLGWQDRFASRAYTERQQRQQAPSGARFVYTPQVLLNGRDWRGWPTVLRAGPAPAAARIVLQREGAQVQARIEPQADAPAQLAGYWAVVEDGLVSQVRAGENVGVTLHHEHVVRRYQPVAPWARGAAPRLALSLTPEDTAAHRRVVFVLTDAAGAQPLQAVSLGC